MITDHQPRFPRQRFTQPSDSTEHPPPALLVLAINTGLIWHDVKWDQDNNSQGRSVNSYGIRKLCMWVNFHLAERRIQPAEALLLYVQIGSSVHLHSTQACYSSVFIRSAIPRRTENVCDTRQLDSICLFSAEMEFQRLQPICRRTLSPHEKLSVVRPKWRKNSISFVYHSYCPTYTKVELFPVWHAGCIVAMCHNLPCQ